MIRMTVRGGAAAARKFSNAGGNIRRELVSATATGTELVAQSARERAVPAKAVNVQDGNAKFRRLSGRTPVRKRFEGNGTAGFVRVQSYQGAARSKAVQAVYGRLGRFKDLQRKGLWLNPSAWTKGPNGRFPGRRKSSYNDRTNSFLRFVRFSDNPQLEDWANRRDKGSQILRHSVRLRPEAIAQLTTGPSLRANEPAIKQLYRAAVVKGIL